MSEISKFSIQQDLLLSKLVRIYGTNRWKIISIHFNDIFVDNPQNSKTCKKRWFDLLNTRNKKKSWSLLEDSIIFDCRNQVGNKWSYISRFLPGKSANEIKNHFYSTLRKNIKRFLKHKETYGKTFISNFLVCFKDKLKSYYSLMYTREKYLLLEKYFDKENKIFNLNSANSNFDKIYFLRLIYETKGSIQILNNYINNLCLEIIVDYSNSCQEMKSNLEEKKSFNLENPSDFSNLQNVIRENIKKSCLSKMLNLIKDISNEELKPLAMCLNQDVLENYRESFIQNGITIIKSIDYDVNSDLNNEPNQNVTSLNTSERIKINRIIENFIHYEIDYNKINFIKGENFFNTIESKLPQLYEYIIFSEFNS